MLHLSWQGPGPPTALTHYLERLGIHFYARGKRARGGIGSNSSSFTGPSMVYWKSGTARNRDGIPRPPRTFQLRVGNVFVDLGGVVR